VSGRGCGSGVARAERRCWEHRGAEGRSFAREYSEQVGSRRGESGSVWLTLDSPRLGSGSLGLTSGSPRFGCMLLVCNVGLTWARLFDEFFIFHCPPLEGKGVTAAVPLGVPPLYRLRTASVPGCQTADSGVGQGGTHPSVFKISMNNRSRAQCVRFVFSTGRFGTWLRLEPSRRLRMRIHCLWLWCQHKSAARLPRHPLNGKARTFTCDHQYLPLWRKGVAYSFHFPS
jgi:hypothetical protein